MGDHREEKDESSGLLQTFENSIEDFRNLIICRVCIRPLFEPYTTQCGHTFCYGCLVRWFERNRIKKSCPDCRCEVLRPPAPAYLVRDMTQIFASRSELMPVGETTEDHKKWQEEEAALVEKDRSSTGCNGGIFRGCFKRALPRGSRRPHFQPIRDAEDGVDRCPRCTWELEDDMCQNCGYRSSNDVDMLTDSDGEDYLSSDDFYDEDEMGSAIMEAFAEGGHMHNLDDGYDPASPSENDYFSDVGPPDGNVPHDDHYRPNRFTSLHGVHHLSPLHGSLLDSSSNETDGESIADEEDPSLDGFVVNDEDDAPHPRLIPPGPVHRIRWDTDEDIGVEDTDNGYGGRSGYESESNDFNASGTPASRYNVEDDSDEGPLPPSRRQSGRVLRNSDLSSDDETLEPRQASSRIRTNNRSRDRPNMPHRSRYAHGHRNRPFHQSRVIDTDSDSDEPITASQRSRRRQTHHSAPSEQDSGAETSSATATLGRHSPMPHSPQHSDYQDNALDDNDSASATSRPHNDGPHNINNGLRRSPSATEDDGTWPYSPAPPFASDEDSDTNSQANRQTDQISHRSPRIQRGRGHGHLDVPRPHFPRRSPASIHRQSPASTARETSSQGRPDRQTQIAERRGNRRRLKAQRERRTEAANGGSPAPASRSIIEV